VKLTKVQKLAYIAKARSAWCGEGSIEIDRGADVVSGYGRDRGVYVQAWVWVEPEQDDENYHD